MKLIVCYGDQSLNIDYDLNDEIEVLYLQICSVFNLDYADNLFLLIDFMGRVIETYEHLEYLCSLSVSQVPVGKKWVIPPVHLSEENTTNIWIIHKNVLNIRLNCSGDLLPGTSLIQPKYK